MVQYKFLNRRPTELGTRHNKIVSWRRVAGTRLGGAAFDGGHERIGDLDISDPSIDANPIDESVGNSLSDNEQDNILLERPESAEINASDESNKVDGNNEEAPSGDSAKEGSEIEANKDTSAGVTYSGSKDVTVKGQEIDKHQSGIGDHDVSDPDDPVPPNKNIDLSIPFCGSCMWKQTKYSCNQRVSYAVGKFSVTKSHAQQVLMEQGHCPETRNAAYDPTPRPPSPLGKMSDCRKRPGPGKGLENFCGHCQWKGVDFSCFKRVEYLRVTYGTPDVVAMQGLMDQGHCMDTRTEEDLKKEKEQGIDMWCGYCMFHAYSCNRYIFGANYIYNKDAESAALAKLDLMGNGYCIMPPYCEDKLAPNDLESIENVADNSTVAANPTNETGVEP